MHQPSSETTVAAGAADQFDLLLEAGHSVKHYWRDLWRYRELFLILAWRDVSVRYKQSVAGVAWAVVQPVLSMIIMTLIFGKVAGLPSEGRAPYALMVFSAMLPWQFFATCLSAASQSIVSNAALVSKVYFPRLIVPGASIVVALVDFLVASLVLAGMFVWYGFAPTWRLVALPPLVVLTVIAALGPALLICALMVRYRDFRFVIPFIMQFGLYISPVAYSSSIVRDKFGDAAFLAYSMNPMVAVIDGFRWSILGGQTPLFWPGIVLSVSLSIAIFTFGVVYFRRTERRFADII